MGHIVRKTEIPGPKSNEWLERRHKAVTNAVAHSTAIAVDRAEGALVWDVDGNCLIDLAGGIGMLAAGHCPQPVVDAMKEQAEKLIHTCAIVATYDSYVECAEHLNEVTPGDFPKKSILCNSGSEAVENAVKFARTYTGRQGVLVFEGAYHGRTLLTLSMTSKYGLFKKGFGPYAPEIYRIPAPNMYRTPKGMNQEDALDFYISQLESALIAQIDPSAIAAIVIEPVQGEAGFLPVPCRYLRKIREICDEHGIVMVADEIQSGMGRTGRMWAIEHSDVVPDLIVSGKSLGSGMPIAALTGRPEIMDSPHPGGAGGTYGGAPLACRAAIESIKMIKQPEFLAHVEKIGIIMREVFQEWERKYEMVGNVRGLGSMMLVELVKDRETKEPAPMETLEIIKRGTSKGLILIRAGLYSNCIRFLPPLVITEEQLREGLAALEEAVAEVSPKRDQSSLDQSNGHVPNGAQSKKTASQLT